jgi:hypothetical protein
VTELHALGAEAEFVRADVRREDDVRNLVDKPSRALVVWTWRSTTPVPKVGPGC